MMAAKNQLRSIVTPMEKPVKNATIIKFRTALLQGGKTATGIRVPEEIITMLGAGKRPPVKVTINGYTYRSSVAVMGGAYMVGVSAAVREQAGVKGGEEVDISIELDTAKREVTVPDDFCKALDNNAGAKQFFESLSYSNKLRYVLAIEQAKTDDTRQRRIDKTISDLQAGKK